jgi:hypothetical protein
MPSPLYFGGLLNQEFLSIPYFMWIIVAMFLIGITGGALWFFFFWWKLKPYHGVLWATIRKFGVSFVFDDNMSFDLITDRSAKVIFNETFRQAQEAENDNTKTPAATIGSVHADFVFDPDKWTYPKSYQHRIIEDIAEKWNTVNPHDQVRTLIKFSRYLHDGMFDEHYANEIAKLKRTYMVPWARVRMMYKDREESGSFGFIMTLANTIRSIEQANYNAYAIYILAFCGFLDLIMIGMWFITRKP